MTDQVPLRADGPDEEQSAGARPDGPATEDGPNVVSDSRPGLVIGLVLLLVFLGILAYAVVLPALR